MALKSRLKRHVVKFARRHRYELTPAWRLEAQPLANHLRKLLSQYEIDCVLDVGGNLGQFRDVRRTDLEWQGLILSFEPVRQYVDHLRMRCAAESKWYILDYALGSQTGAATINVTRSPGLNSILSARTDAVPGFWSSESATSTETITVQTLDSVLDDLREKHGFSLPYLKIDTQGFDLEVLKGATKVLENIPALQTEASVKSIYIDRPGVI